MAFRVATLSAILLASILPSTSSAQSRNHEWYLHPGFMDANAAGRYGISLHYRVKIIEFVASLNVGLPIIGAGLKHTFMDDERFMPYAGLFWLDLIFLAPNVGFSWIIVGDFGIRVDTLILVSPFQNGTVPPMPSIGIVWSY